MMKLNKFSWGLLVVFIVTSGMLLYSFPKSKDDWSIIYWGIIGSNASVLGIIYTVVSLNQLRRESEIISATTKETRQKIGAFTGIADLARAIKLVQEVQGYARLHKYEVGIIRLQELKIVVSQLRVADLGLPVIPDLTDTLFSINKLIGSMEKEITSKTSNLKIVLVNKALENISDLLVEMQTEMIKRN